MITWEKQIWEGSKHKLVNELLEGYHDDLWHSTDGKWDKWPMFLKVFACDIRRAGPDY
jgi:hypothetical protein